MLERYGLLIIFGVIAVLSSIFGKENDYGSPLRKWSCVILCVIFVLQAGLRDWENNINESNDTLRYASVYFDIENTPLNDLMQSFSFFADEYGDRDAGFPIFVKLTQMITVDFSFFLLVVASIISVPICYILYKYSSSVAGIFLGACLYEALFAGFYETGIRQTIAMGISFVALEFFLNKKYIWWIVLTIIAYTIHTSALIFIPLYLFLKWGKPQFILIGCIIMAPIFMYYSKQIMFFLGSDTIIGGYVALDTESNKGTPIFTAMVTAAVLMTYFLANRIKEHYKYYDLMFLCMAFAIMLVPATWVNSNFLRLELYFLTFLMPLLSVLIDAFANYRKILIPINYAAVSIILMVLAT